jgi:queuine/archaeosine tRNA-ribosyltransferase
MKEARVAILNNNFENFRKEFYAKRVQKSWELF